MTNLETDALQLALDETSGKITSLRHKPTGQQWLWTHTPHSAGASFDEQWSGGLDVLFPCDEACPRLGEAYADHGMCWQPGWQLAVADATGFLLRRSSQHIHLAYSGRATGPLLRLRLEAENRGTATLPFLFRWHPAFPLQHIAHMVCRAGQLFADAAFHHPPAKKGCFAWPHLPLAGAAAGSQPANLSQPSALPPGQYGMVYAPLPDGRVVLHSHSGGSLALQSNLPWLSLFYSNGGWQGHQVWVPEPASAPLCSLDDMAAQGHGQALAPGESRTFLLDIRLG